MLETAVQGVTLTPFGGIGPLDDLGTAGPGEGCGIVCAIIRDNEQSVAWAQLAADVCKGR
jgi:hypothetical protein